jgi:hypothetical protein
MSNVERRMSKLCVQECVGVLGVSMGVGMFYRGDAKGFLKSRMSNVGLPMSKEMQGG